MFHLSYGWQVILDNRWVFVSGVGRTLAASLVALALALAIGVVVGVVQVWDLGPARRGARVYVEFFQNTPLLIQVFFIYHGLPRMGLKLSSISSGVVGLAVYTGAYIAEVVRAGIQSVPRGQMEAARSSGMSYLRSMWYVVLPQAFRMTLPPLANQFVNLVKNSAVLAVIAGGDLMFEANILSADTFVTFEVYIVTAALYLSMTLPLSSLVNYIERRVSAPGPGGAKRGGALGAAVRTGGLAG